MFSLRTETREKNGKQNQVETTSIILLPHPHVRLLCKHAGAPYSRARRAPSSAVAARSKLTVAATANARNPLGAIAAVGEHLRSPRRRTLSAQRLALER